MGPITNAICRCKTKVGCFSRRTECIEEHLQAIAHDYANEGRLRRVGRGDGGLHRVDFLTQERQQFLSGYRRHAGKASISRTPPAVTCR